VTDLPEINTRENQSVLNLQQIA